MSDATPRDDIAGLIDDIEDRRSHPAYPHHLDDLLDEAATQLAALSARVKELEFDIAGFRLINVLYKNSAEDAEARALRAEQERDEAYELAAKVADDLDEHWSREWRDGLKADTHLEGMSDGATAIAAAIRRLASGPEKEKKE